MADAIIWINGIGGSIELKAAARPKIIPNIRPAMRDGLDPEAKEMKTIKK